MLLPVLAFIAIVVGTSGPKPVENDKLFLAPADEHVIVVGAKEAPAVELLQAQGPAFAKNEAGGEATVVGPIVEIADVVVEPLAADDSEGSLATPVIAEKVEEHLLVAGSTPFLGEVSDAEKAAAKEKGAHNHKKSRKTRKPPKEEEKTLPPKSSQTVLVGDFPSLADGHARLEEAKNQRLVRASILNGIGGTGNGKVTCEIDEKGYSNTICYDAKVVLDQQLSAIVIQPPAPILERSIKANWTERIEELRRGLKETHQRGNQYSRKGLLQTSRTSTCPKGGERAPSMFHIQQTRNCLARVAYAQEYYGNTPTLATRDYSGVQVDTYTQQCIEESNRTPLFCNADSDDST